MVRQVVIVGAGLGGLACALACAGAGLQVDVLESRPVFAPVPAHVDVVPNLLRDLQRLGVADHCVRAGFGYQGVAVVDESGRQHFELTTPKLSTPSHPAAVGIAFDRLHGLLEEAARQAGARLHMGRPVVRIEADRGRAWLADGTAMAADLVVLSAGANSPLVQQVFERQVDCDAAQSWWHALIPRPQRLDRATWMIGERERKLLLLPVSMQEAGVAVLTAPNMPAAHDGAAMSALLDGWGEWPRRIADLVKAQTPTVVRTAPSGLLSPPWSRGAVLVAGASAHAIASPFGQSVAQAVEDAVVLAELLAMSRDRDLLVARYLDRRVARASRVHMLTRQAARWITRPEPSTDLKSLADELGSLLAFPA